MYLNRTQVHYVTTCGDTARCLLLRFLVSEHLGLESGKRIIVEVVELSMGVLSLLLLLAAEHLRLERLKVGIGERVLVRLLLALALLALPRLAGGRRVLYLDLLFI